jgi:hypothetical protein
LTAYSVAVVDWRVTTGMTLKCVVSSGKKAFLTLAAASRSDFWNTANWYGPLKPFSFQVITTLSLFTPSFG